MRKFQKIQKLFVINASLPFDIKRFLIVFPILVFLLSACSTTPKNNVIKATSNQLIGSNTQTKLPYLIGIEDVLNISVWKELDLNHEVIVRPDGKISFPLVGDIAVKNKTVDDVKEAVKVKIEKYIPNALVTVSLVKSSSYKIYVLGKVNSPGQYVQGNYIDVLQALSLANGLTPFASQDDIKILSKRDGQEVTFPFAYSRASTGKNMDQNIILRSGDVVMVP